MQEKILMGKDFNGAKDINGEKYFDGKKFYRGRRRVKDFSGKKF